MKPNLQTSSAVKLQGYCIPNFSEAKRINAWVFELKMALVDLKGDEFEQELGTPDYSVGTYL